MDNNTKYIIFGASGDLSRRYLLPALEHMAVDVILVSRKDYPNLKSLVGEAEEKIFHLAIPPEAVTDAIKMISENFGRENIKILLEKPFGKDLASAQDLISHIDQYFPESQIYRVDHYLAKKSLQNIMHDKWDTSNAAKIEVIASEKIDIEGRVGLYEQTGALKDFVQSHLIEMAAVVLAGSYDAAKRHEALKQLEVVCDITKHECVKRGQYEGYRAEVGNPTSMTETFVSINAVSNDPVWRGVPIILSTGKALSEKLTQIKITYKDGIEKVFNIEHEPDAYERVINAALAGDHNIFISSEEVQDSWRILDAIQQTWKDRNDDLIIYKKGVNINEI